MKSFFYKVFYKELKFYDISPQLTPEKRWTRIQNDFFYKPQTLPTLLRTIFEEAKQDGMIPKFSVVKEQVTKVEPKIKIKKEKKEPIIKEKKERIKLSLEQKRENRIKYEKANAEIIKAKRKEHYEANKEKLLADKREYHQNHRDIIIAQKRQYRIDNKEKISIQKREKYLRKKLEKELAQSHCASSFDAGS